MVGRLITSARVSHLHNTASTRRRAPRRVWRAWTGKQPWAFALGLALLLPQLQAKGAASAQQSAQGFDLWAMATGWLKSHGALGFLALGGLAFAGYALSQAQNWEALLRLLGRGPKPPEPPPTTRNETRGPNSPVITGGEISPGGDLVFGEKHEHTHLPPPPKPELPESHTPHNLPERTTTPDRFVGREAELQRLAELLAPEGSRVYLTGMGGVGKSQLGLQHAYDHLEHYSGGVVRLDARQGLSAMASQLVTFFRGAFPEVRLPDDKSPIELLPLCWNQWPEGAHPPEPVLLILDDQRGENLDDQQGDKLGYGAELQLFAGLPPRFRRLITQREPAPTGAKAIDLPLLQRKASLELLALQAGEGGPERLEEEPQAADGLCAEVGDLPLALVLLGARLAERPDLKPAHLLGELQIKGAEAKALQQAHPELGAQRGVLEALLISWEPLSGEAQSLAMLLAEMAPAVIPWVMVEACRFPDQQLEEGSAFGDPQAELLHGKFLERVKDRCYQLHPLVRQFTRLKGQAHDKLVGMWRKQFAAVIARLCRGLVKDTMNKDELQTFEAIIPHVKVVAEQFAGDLLEEDLLEPFRGLVRVAEHHAAFDDALKWSEKCLDQCERRLGPNHLNTSHALVNLAMQSLKTTKRLSQAEGLMRRALKILESNYGKEHADVAMCLCNLSHILITNENRYDEAESLLRRALAIEEKTKGADNPNFAILLNNLAQTLQSMNRIEEAESLMQRALTINQTHYGSNHPMLALQLYNMAVMLLESNRLSKAEMLFRRALSLDEERYDNDHPDISRDLNGLAQLLQKTNRLTEAEPLMRRALAMNEVSYGSDHPEVAVCLNNLAMLLQRTNQLGEASQLMKRALFIAWKNFGLDHKMSKDFLGNYTSILRLQGLSEQEIHAEWSGLVNSQIDMLLVWQLLNLAHSSHESDESQDLSGESR
jgi:tetratricopeptide (TPR) repeat protein